MEHRPGMEYHSIDQVEMRWKERKPHSAPRRTTVVGDLSGTHATFGAGHPAITKSSYELQTKDHFSSYHFLLNLQRPVRYSMGTELAENCRLIYGNGTSRDLYDIIWDTDYVNGLKMCKYEWSEGPPRARAGADMPRSDDRPGT
ncbi:unnamed protein product [Sympodiomycopsis kandeliae]